MINISTGSLLSLNKPGNGDKSGIEVTVSETFFGEFEQANNYRVTSRFPGATAEGTRDEHSLLRTVGLRWRHQ